MPPRVSQQGHGGQPRRRRAMQPQARIASLVHRPRHRPSGSSTNRGSAHRHAPDEANARNRSGLGGEAPQLLQDQAPISFAVMYYLSTSGESSVVRLAANIPGEGLRYHVHAQGSANGYDIPNAWATGEQRYGEQVSTVATHGSAQSARSDLNEPQPDHNTDGLQTDPVEMLENDVLIWPAYETDWRGAAASNVAHRPAHLGDCMIRRVNAGYMLIDMEDERSER